VDLPLKLGQRRTRKSWGNERHRWAYSIIPLHLQDDNRVNQINAFTRCWAIFIVNVPSLTEGEVDLQRFADIGSEFFIIVGHNALLVKNMK